MEKEVVRICKATLADIDSLIRLRSYLLDNAIEIYGSKIPEDQKRWKEAYKSWLTDYLNSDCDVVIFVAVREKDNQLVGCVTGVIDKRAPTIDCINGLCGWIQSMIVQEDMKQKGVATRLMNRLNQWFSEHGVTKLTLQSTCDAEVFYQKLGFHLSNEKTFFLLSK
ncbi:GNAT family N-acetyltransferase [Xenorhabdus sp. TH1]|uniref:GNAT family N-acetyltransferase n=1 Tax=Xenorhabdus sp. TH1 TaxID=3130166 RepID=UPI0030D2A351